MFWVYVVMHADGISPVLISSNVCVYVSMHATAVLMIEDVLMNGLEDSRGYCFKKIYGGGSRSGGSVFGMEWQGRL